jgi:hypothetical protein
METRLPSGRTFREMQSKRISVASPTSARWPSNNDVERLALPLMTRPVV